MSMISGQCDELRETASQLENLYNLDRYARDVYLAADTIWELRCKLAGVVDQRERIAELEVENAKLKRAAERDADVLESLNLSLEESQAENAKLWEYVEWLEDFVLSGFFTKDIEFEIEMKRRELGVPR